MQSINSQDVQNIFTILESAQTVLVTAHENPDGDALASIGVWYDYALAAGKTAYAYVNDKPDEAFAFLPHVGKYLTDASTIPFGTLDAVIVVDCASVRRTGIEAEIAGAQVPVINIDHHISNNRFGTVNVIDPDAVSTTQIIYEILKAGGVSITKDRANCILTGILTDSGNFAYAATNAATFDIASEMLMRGANARDIITYTYKNKSLRTLKAWGLALSRLRVNGTYGVAHTVLSGEDMRRFHIDKDDLEGLANFLNTLKDATIILVLYELGDGRVKGSFRTTSDDVDVSKIALALGGGGHAKAAGFEVEGKLVQDGERWKIE